VKHLLYLPAELTHAPHWPNFRPGRIAPALTAPPPSSAPDLVEDQQGDEDERQGYGHPQKQYLSAQPYFAN